MHGGVKTPFKLSNCSVHNTTFLKFYFLSKGITMVHKVNACKLSSMQLYHFMFGSGLMEILACMFDLEVTCWETGRKTTETFKLLGKHVNAEGIKGIIVGYLELDI